MNQDANEKGVRKSSSKKLPSVLLKKTSLSELVSREPNATLKLVQKSVPRISLVGDRSVTSVFLKEFRLEIPKYGIHSLFPALDTFSKSLEKLTSSVTTPFDTFLTEFSERLKDIVPKTDLSSLFAGLDLERLSLRIEVECAKALAATGWPYPRLHRDEIQDFLVKMLDEGTLLERQTEVDQLMTQLFSKQELKQITEDWCNSHLSKSRSQIIRKALRAHIAGDYELSVPVFVIQIEGIVARGNSVGEYMSQKMYKEYISKFSNISNDRDIREIGQIANFMLISLMNNFVLASFEHGHAPETELSRHAILHGGDIGYATETNSLRAILILDAVHKAFSYVSIVGSKVFHEANCPRVKNSEKPIEFGYDFDEMESHGLRPCSYCFLKTCTT